MNYISQCIQYTLINLTIIICVAGESYGQKVFLKNFPKNNYRVIDKVTSPQNWDIQQLPNGKILICNSSGILVYNGLDWDMVVGTENKDMLSLTFDDSRTIYTAGKEDFGYFKINPIGKETFVSLSKYLGKKVLSDKLHSVKSLKNDVFLKSKSQIIKFSMVDSSHQILNYSSNKPGLYLINEKISFQNDENELLTFDGIAIDTLWKKKTETLPKIVQVLDLGQSKQMLVTSSKGLYIYNGEIFNPLPSELDKITKSHYLKDAIHLGQNLIAIATLGAGIIIIDTSGNVIQHITTEEGLLSNTVYSISKDSNSGIWLGLDIGIARVEYPSPLAYYDNSKGIEGIVLSVMTYKNTIYCGTTAGLFIKHSQNSNFQKVPELRQIWDIKVVKDKILLASSRGVYQLDKGLPKLLVDSKSRIFFQPKSSPNRLLVGLKDGLGKLEWKGMSWIWAGSYEGIEHEIRNIVQVEDSIWMSHESITSATYNFETDSFSIRSTLHPGIDFSNDLWQIEVSLINNEVFFGTPKGIYKYNSKMATIIPDSTFGSVFASGEREAFAIVQDQNKAIWLTSNKRNGPITLSDNESYFWDTLNFVRLNQTEVWRIVPDREKVWFGTSDGLYQYDKRFGVSSSTSYPVFINQVELNRDSIPYYSGNISEYPSFSYDLNDLRFRYSAASYNAGEELEFQFFMEGYDDDWSEWDKEVTKEYTNLSPGEYTFRVKAKNLYGKESNEAAFSFDILTPIHRSVTAYVLYSIFLIGLIYTGAKTQQRRIVARQKSKLKAREAELKKEREISSKLRMVDKLKDEFLANTSHELRTPLNGIIGISESLIDKDVPPDSNEIKENLSLVVASGKRLASMVDGILDYSKLRTANLELYKRTVDLKSLTEVVASMSRPLIKGHPVEIINSLPDNFPQAWADENRVQQIMYNLIGNAIKFTERGTITISAKVVENEIEVQIADTGVGIPEDKIDTIFESYEQLSESVDRDYIGTGLGLTITKKLVELHDGRIWVKSILDQGSIFFFTLPISSEEIAPVRSTIPDWTRNSVLSNDGPKKEKATGLKILIVDDEPVNQKVLSNILEAEGFQLTLASNGEKALELLDETHPDLVLLDIMMPKMSGYEVCEKIRNKRLMSELPVIFITAKNEIKDLVEGLSYGANDYVTKPFSKEEFLARVNTHLNLYKINDSYSRFVPHEFLRLLNRDSIIDVNLGDQIEKTVTILFSDIRGYTSISEKMTPKENFNYLNRYLKKVGPVISDNNGFISHYYGDGIMALFSQAPEEALKASLEIVAKVREFNEEVMNEGLNQIQIGIGLHAGPSMLGILGDEKRMDASLVSDSVNIASRMEGLTKFYSASIIISESTLKQIKNKDDYLHRFLGKVVVKGKSRTTNVIEIFEADEEKARALKLKTRPEFEVGIMNYLAKNFTEAAANFKNVIEANPDDAAANFYLKNSAKFMVEGVPDDWKGIENIQFK